MHRITRIEDFDGSHSTVVEVKATYTDENDEEREIIWEWKAEGRSSVKDADLHVASQMEPNATRITDAVTSLRAPHETTVVG